MPGVVVPMPRLPVVFVRINFVDVAKYVSLRVAKTRSPPGVVDAIQCLRSVPAVGFERTSWGVDVDDTWSAPNGVDVPMPRRPCCPVVVSTVMKFVESIVVAPE